MFRAINRVPKNNLLSRSFLLKRFSSTVKDAQDQRFSKEEFNENYEKGYKNGYIKGHDDGWGVAFSITLVGMGVSIFMGTIIFSR